MKIYSYQQLLQQPIVQDIITMATFYIKKFLFNMADLQNRK